jgi:hypothetical protein
MPKRSSGLFLACAENIVTSSVLYSVLAGIMDTVMPSDFSPAMRAAMQ